MQQQSLTTEAASVLKQSLTLARRRGHDQVTPLHVASTLLGSRASLLKRACIYSQKPHHPLLNCRALELCFNVALNRLPTAPPPPSVAHPCLSNALVAALKRAQAHHKRDQNHQAAVLSVKVELEQLVLSILDDPSVSRVMREAGFSSALVKNNLEKDLSSSLLPSPSPSSSLAFQCYSSYGGVFSCPSSPTSADLPLNSAAPSLNSHLLNYSSEQIPFISFTKYPQNNTADLKMLLKEVLMSRRNSVIVSDNVPITEGLMSELIEKVESGDSVPEELKQTHFIKFQFTPLSLRFMRREDVVMNLSHLKRKVVDCFSSGEELIVYAGDLKWAIHESTTSDNGRFSGYNPVDHLVSELGNLLSTHSNSDTPNKLRLMANASYQTYMKCQMKQPSLVIQWSLHPVSLFPRGHDRLCLSLSHAGQNDELVELRREWNLSSSNMLSFVDSSHLPRLRRQQSCNFEVTSCDNWINKHQMATEPRLDRLKETNEGKEVKISLALENSRNMIDVKSISKLLEENVPWQSKSIPLIAEALADSKTFSKKERWFLIQGKDFIGKRRLSLAIAASVFGSTDCLCLLEMNASDSDNGFATTCSEILGHALKKHEKLVVLVESMNLVDNTQFIKFLADRYETRNISQSIFILSTGDEKKMRQNHVIQLKLQANHKDPSSATPDFNHKRRAEIDDSNSNKNPKTEKNNDQRQSTTIDLNKKADDFIQEKPEDLVSNDVFYKGIQNSFVFDSDPAHSRIMKDLMMSKIKGSFEEYIGRENSKMICIFVEERVLEELAVGSSSFLNSLFENWLQDIFQTSLEGVNIGASLKLCFGGKEGDQVLGNGYMDSCLPNNIPVSFMD